MPQSRSECLRKVRKNVNPINISKIKYKENNLKMRQNMKEFTNNLEKLAKEEAKKDAIKIYDLSTTLPPKLYDRISKIVPLIPIDEDNFEDDHEKEKIIEVGESMFDKEEFNESTCSLIEALEIKYDSFEINIENENIRKRKVTKNCSKNWLSKYICEKRQDRIKWNSKLYPLETNIQDKKLDEQAEILMNSASERFADWINNINKNTETNITKEFLMTLFKVNSGSNILGSIQIDPKIMSAVPKRVAVTWEMEENSIELKLANKIKEIMDKVPKKVITTAFGSTLPYHMRPWIPTDAYNIIKPEFPEELRKCKLLFEGITHLKAIREFVNYCKSDADVEKPEYLVEVGCFKKKNIAESQGQAIPLYELLDCEF